MPDELDLLRKLGHELVEPDEDSEERARELLQQRIDAVRADGRARRARRPRLRWSLLIASAMLLVGSALGFGVGSALTPSGSAGGNVGFGFLPAHGWNVMQSGTLDDAGRARAIATNIRLQPEDDLLGAPKATLRSLPQNSVVLFATFSLRGDPVADSRHLVRELPLQFEDAEELYPWHSLGRYRLRAGVGGYNVDVRIYFGEYAPSTRAVATAQAQLDRLVVSAERVTLRARPTLVSNGTVTLSGSVDNENAGEDVKIQAKDCGLDFFRVVGGAVTEEGGFWRTILWQFPSGSRTVRAVWNDATSVEVLIRKRSHVALHARGQGRFEVSVWQRRVWRKRAVIQRFDRRLGAWQPIKTVVLTNDGSATFRLSLPKGTRIRAIFPRSQSGPCYLEGTSSTVTT